jgi:hypothetical protein
LTASFIGGRKFLEVMKSACLSFSILIGLAAATALSAVTPAPVLSLDDPRWQREPVARGAELLQGAFADLFGSPQFVSVLRVDLQEPGVHVRFHGVIPRQERRTSLPELVDDTGAVAAVNGGFGHNRRWANSGILKVDGEIYPFLQEEPEEMDFAGAAAVGIDEEENWYFIDRPGDAWPEDWPEVRHALAGGHRLVENGQIHSSLFADDSPRAQRHNANRHPRTALGVTADRHLLLVTVDGRHSGNAHGITLTQLALLLQDWGCVDALNLEGGGATTMWLRDRGVVNHPSDNGLFDPEGARRIRSAVLLFAEPLSQPRPTPAGEE